MSKNDIIKPGDQGSLIEIIKSGGLGDVKPFEQEIYLIDAHIAGTSHIYNIEDIEPSLKRGMPLKFMREPDNPADDMAIIVKDGEDRKIGYVPRAKNEILARLMDAGKLVYCKVYDKQWVDDWLLITIEIYLKD